jgi:hypothetical protein
MKYVVDLKPVRGHSGCRNPFIPAGGSCIFLSQLKGKFEEAEESCHQLKSNLFQPRF